MAVYLVLLAASHIARWLDPSEAPRLDPTERSAETRVVDGEGLLEGQVRIVFWDHAPVGSRGLPTILLLHGSPGSKRDFGSIAPLLAARFRVVALDFPGFGKSERDVPDYSVRAHALYSLQLMDELGVGAAHLVGFSMGGGVALNLQDLAPDRTRSISLLSSIGVQEFELLGDYHLNHLLHSLQLGVLLAVREGIPHFGRFDRAFLGVPYARNFFDSDQRPLRQILSNYVGPLFIFHGAEDPLVPKEAALEHHRISPQSVLEMTADSHFAVFRKEEEISRLLMEFIDRVESGEDLTRRAASAERLAKAAQPFDPRNLPEAAGLTLLILLGLIAAATFVSEDLTCILVGLMVASGRIDFWWGTAACFAGIYAGDMALFWAGRLMGRPAVALPPLSWVIRPDDLRRSSEWLNRRGPIVVMATRFLPGTRLPTYFAAGLLHTRFWLFSFYFLVPALIWTPGLVLVAMLIGRDSLDYLTLAEDYALPGLLLVAVLILVMTRLIVPLFTRRGRRLLVGRGMRLVNWEFWPPWVFYSPVVIYVVWLSLRFRSATLFTLANPAIPESGVIGESKVQILEGLDAPEVARFRVLPAGATSEEAVRKVQRVLDEAAVSFPLVLKPDRGERGRGVRIAADMKDVRDYFSTKRPRTILQEYVGGREFGVFYYRLPGHADGNISSVTIKVLPEIQGDGARTIENLILDDPRAVGLARRYFKNLGRRLDEIPPAGTRIRLTELGTHCLGAVFQNGVDELPEAVSSRLAEISRGFEGFYFGRYDIRLPSESSPDFKILELNGVTSEATHIYDPRYTLRDAYRTLFRQWSIAFEIGRLNRKKGLRPTGPWRLVQVIWSAWRM